MKHTSSTVVRATSATQDTEIGEEEDDEEEEDGGQKNEQGQVSGGRARTLGAKTKSGNVVDNRFDPLTRLLMSNVCRSHGVRASSVMTPSSSSSSSSLSSSSSTVSVEFNWSPVASPLVLSLGRQTSSIQSSSSTSTSSHDSPYTQPIFRLRPSSYSYSPHTCLPALYAAANALSSQSAQNLTLPSSSSASSRSSSPPTSSPSRKRPRDESSKASMDTPFVCDSNLIVDIIPFR